MNLNEGYGVCSLRGVYVVGRVQKARELANLRTLSPTSLMSLSRSVWRRGVSGLACLTPRSLQRYFSSPCLLEEAYEFESSTLPEQERRAFEHLVLDGFPLYKDFISESEQAELLKDTEKDLGRLKYEFDHWDGAIHGYREIRKSRWSTGSLSVFQRMRELAMLSNLEELGYVHVLDLAKNGVIKPHVDNVNFCGPVIVGISLLSDAIMRFAQKESDLAVKVLLPARSLYIMRGEVRYHLTHEVLEDAKSVWRGKPVKRDRRISMLLRVQPTS